VDQIEEPWPSPGVVNAVFDMTWRILRTNGFQFFITTDNPVFFFRGWGIGRPQSELTFTLPSTHAIHGSRQGAPGDLIFLEVNQKFVREINRRLASQTDRLAFYHTDAPWLLGILPKQDQYLSAIRW
jgi:Protein of unknown function (DUF4238)